jgi:hypothetical protein
VEDATDDLIKLKTGVSLKKIQDFNEIIWRDGFFSSTKEQYWNLIK